MRLPSWHELRIACTRSQPQTHGNRRDADLESTINGVDAGTPHEQAVAEATRRNE
jgi:hypothetical protein